jgi:hypothetical protein
VEQVTALRAFSNLPMSNAPNFLLRRKFMELAGIDHASAWRTMTPENGPWRMDRNVSSIQFLLSTAPLLRMFPPSAGTFWWSWPGSTTHSE